MNGLNFDIVTFVDSVEYNCVLKIGLNSKTKAIMLGRLVKNCEVHGDANGLLVSILEILMLKSRFGRPMVKKIDEILRKIEEDPHISSHDIAAELCLN